MKIECQVRAIHERNHNFDQKPIGVVVNSTLDCSSCGAHTKYITSQGQDLEQIAVKKAQHFTEENCPLFQQANVIP